MLSDKMEKAINDQIKNELYSSYLYLSMAMYFHAENFSGMGRWMEAQAKEEQFHAEKFMNYVNDRGGRVSLQAIDQPPADFKSPLQIFEEALKHEQFITGKINELVDLARDEKDHATYAMLQWFVTEQVEEEATADGIVQQLKLIGDAPAPMLMMDAQLGRRGGAPSGGE